MVVSLLLDHEIKWLNSKFPNNVWKNINHDWREGTYKNYFWMIPYNLEGLINIIGGKQVAEKRLDSLFTRLDAKYEEDWFAAGNEPDFHVPWVYNWINRPDKTSKTINRILNEQYNSSESGLPGNDDLLNNCWMTSFSCSIHLKSGILRNGDFKKFFIPRFIFCCGCCDLW